MAAKRDNTASRWVLGLASGAAALAFWAGIVNGPQPANANPAPAQVAQSASTSRQFQGQSGSGISNPSQTRPQPQARVVTPRLRTRGS